MTPEARATALIASGVGCSDERQRCDHPSVRSCGCCEDIAEAIRQAENDALERAAAVCEEAARRIVGMSKRVNQVDRHTADVLENQARIIRRLKHEEPAP